ncbi:MAG: hypothetical protein OEV79_11955 [candidate division WOR-3 bacterium]|nr:hypothetical protein [candidate division WOR-3 bacterium]
MIFIVIALGIVVFLWLVSFVIQKLEKAKREEYIKMKQEERKKEEEAKERANRPRFY